MIFLSSDPDRHLAVFEKAPSAHKCVFNRSWGTVKITIDDVLLSITHIFLTHLFNICAP